MQLNTRALFSLIPAALIAPATFSAPVAPRADGYTITMRVSPGTEAPFTAMFKTAGAKMRLEADMSGLMGGRGGPMFNGAYMLPKDDGKIVIVAPNVPNMSGGTGISVAMDIAGMAARMGGAPPKVTDVTIEDMGAGETILGYRTHKYRVRQPDNTVEAWIAELPGADFKKFATGFGARFAGVDHRLIEKIPSGWALKVVVTGKDAVTMDVTKVEKTSFTDSEFEVPAGIQDMSGMMGGRGRGGF